MAADKNASLNKTTSIAKTPASPAISAFLESQTYRDMASRIKELESELSQTRESLRAAGHDFSHLRNQGHTSSIEDMQAVNEELQAANEEMEASRDELQSQREDLSNVTGQLKSKIMELEVANNDLINLYSGTNIPTLFLDAQLKVKRFSPAMTEFTDLMPSDIGRPLGAMLQKQLGDDLLSDALAVLNRLEPVSRESAINGAVYLRTSLPSISSDGHPEGVAITYFNITEHKLVEKTLRESEERYKSFFQGLPLSTVVFQAEDNDFGIVDYNKAALTFTGNQMPDFLGKRASELYKSYPTILDKFTTVFNSKTTQSIEIPYRKVSTNEDIYLRFTLSFASPDKIIVHSEDFTERHNALEALKYQDRLLSVTHKAIFGIDANYCILYWNKGAEKLFGWSKEEVFGKDSGELLQNKIEGSTRAIEISKLIENGHWEGEVQYLHKGGSYVLVEVSASILAGPDGELQGIVTAARDISERKRAEEELIRRAAMLDAIGRSTPDCIFVKDSAGRMLYASPGLFRLLNKTADQILNKIDTEWHPNVNEALALMENDRKVMQSGEALVVEEKYTDFQGEHIYLSTKSPIHDASGKVIGLVGLSSDITERKQLEEALRRHAAELTAANNNLDDFAHSITHDLRNPLSAILACCEVAKEALPSNNDDGHKALEYITASAKRMASIINDLMSLMQVTSQEVKLSPCNLSDMAIANYEELAIMDPSRKVEIIIEPGLVADADEGLLWILLQNLINNAWKFTSKKADARIEAGKQVDGESTFFYVRDNGVGFDMAQAERLFKPYQRLHNKNDYSGTGIGLTIVKRIVEKHGGTIKVEARKDKGATFYFSLSCEAGGGKYRANPGW